MQALVNAGGKGTRMGKCGIEKPMQMVGDRPTIQRVIDALSASKHIDRVYVSVSDHTLVTEEYLEGMGVRTIRTSGESFMDDLHTAFERMEGEYVLTCPSDLPLLSTRVIDEFIEYFDSRVMESAIAVVDEETVRGLGITPSYTREHRGNQWVLSGVCIMNRPRTLAGEYLDEYIFDTNWPELAVNVNTMRELDLARSFFRERRPRPLCPCISPRPCP
ncbi:MAG: NTP transferase domain-containing protein [Thermoplasmata archaeon]|nr:NTP transferase domain-containing protein [Thermoplasmata archaeon]